MTEDEFSATVFEMLWNLTDTYPTGGSSCAGTAEKITEMAREIERDDTDG